MIASRLRAAGLAAALLLLAPAGRLLAQTIYSEDFTGAASSNLWYFSNGACLTAGTGTALTQPGGLPSCGAVWTSYYSLQQPDKVTHGVAADAKLVGGSAGTATGGVTTAPLDPAGSGALRFTNGFPYGQYESGSIVSKAAFNAGQGVHITFKAVSYRGDSGNVEGADGMSFFLIDGSLAPGSPTYDGIGAPGGSLGYSCSNINTQPDGLAGGYIGLGIDEFGNYLNGAQLLSPYTGPNVAGNDNTAYGYGAKPNRIGMRGAGNVSWAALSSNYPHYYPSSLTATQRIGAVQKTCMNGAVLDYSGGYTPTPAVVTATGLASFGYTQVKDYAPIAGAYVELPYAGASPVLIANESALARPTGVTSAAGVTDGNVFVYDLNITQNGLLSLSYSVNGGAFSGVISSQSITASNGLLPATLRFGFAGSSGGSTNVHELLCFKAAPADASSSSSTTDQQQTGKLDTSSQAYFAYYNPIDRTGRMTAYGLSVDSAGVLTIASSANWDSQCVLTGISGINPATATCPTTGASTPTAGQPAASGSSGSRVMLTWNGTDTATDAGSAGVPFEWPGSAGVNSITTADGAVLDAGDPSPPNANRLNYLRGARSNEIDTSGAGLFRARDGVLGDIVDSSPVWVGPPSAPYSLKFKDRYVTGDATPENTAATNYAKFITANQYRLNTIYVGANDGFLHAFRSGAVDSTGALITTTPSGASTPNDGVEILAYMPGTILASIHNAANGALDYANPQYGHQFSVDATPGTGDLFYGGAWHTWLVGGLGAGGAAIYALDITDPSPTNFTEARASSVVIGDWSAATIACANVSSCGSNLGNTYGTPLIRRLHDGSWGVIFGNGFGSSSGDAGIYVMTIDQSTAAKTFYYLSTGSSSGANGIAYVTAADLDGDHITDYVYAGDLQGNVWRFDLTAATPSGWGVNAANAPLFKSQTGQPITTPVVVAAAALVGSAPSVIVSFGTGQRTQFTTTSGVVYAGATQSLYGVWDWNLGTWNSHSAAQYATLTSAQVAAASGLSSPYTLGYGNLQAQTFTAGATAGTVDTSNATVNWAMCTATGTITCSATAFGWYANLIGTNGTGSFEQAVSNPTLFQQALILNSTVPAANTALSCTTSADTGNTYVISVLTGGTFTTTATTTTTGTSNKTSAFVTSNHDNNMVATNTNESGALTVVNTSSSTYLVGQSITPTLGQAPGSATAIKLPTNIQVNRVTWTQIR